MDKTDKHDALASLTVPTTPGQGGGTPLPPSDPLPISELDSIGGFQLTRLLGRGGMGAVYEAIDPDLGRAVAVKVMLPSMATNKDAREQFLREARTVAAVKHDHVVTIFRVGEERGIPYLAMELLAGESLADRCRRSPLAIGETVRVVREVAAGLAAIHTSGVIHRDVKPDNIWLESPGGRAKLLDFGLARRWEDAPPLGSMAGTLVYMAPEQAKGSPVDHRSDLFALGVVAYRLLTGRVPFAGDSMKEIVDTLLTADPTPVQELNPSVPKELAKLVHRMLDKAPSRRPSTAADVVRELATIEARMMVSGSGVIGSGMTVIVLPSDGRLAPPDGEPLSIPLTRPSTSEPTLPALPLPLRAAPPRRREFARLSAAVVGTVLTVGVAGLLVLANRGPSGVSVSPTSAPPPPSTAAAPVSLAPPPRSFRPLFDGETLDGWYHVPREPRTAWAARDGLLVCTPPPMGTGDQFLLTDHDYDDFDLRLEYRWVAAGGHTTVLLRAYATNAKDKAKEPEVRGIMVNIGDDAGFPLIHGRDIGNGYRTGSVQFVTTRRPQEVKSRPIGEWNELRVSARRQHIKVTHNGEVTAVADLDQHLDKVGRMPELARSKGAIGLVAHWGPSEYRNIRLTNPHPEK
mgnify:CR=1 FL=1